jgi:cation diffusion facilitator CzcD-associated flavoprotein CzcO
MLVENESAATAAESWLAKLESGLAGHDVAALQKLFHADSHWRDVLALTWRIGTVSGAAALARALQEHAIRARPAGFRLDPERTAPREVTRAGEKCVEAMFRFDTVDGPGNGVVRFKGDRAWTLATALEDLKRGAPQQSASDDPTVLIVGGGHAGLSIAARLAHRGIDALIVDRWPRVGDNWRRRYGALRLHNQVYVNHLPYLRYPDGFPVYIPKDLLADWFETYAERLKLDYWTSTEFLGGSYESGCWRVRVNRDGKVHELRPRHVVLATGVSGIPSMPEIAALKGFRGKVLHSSQYENAAAWKGKRTVVVGTGTSGHDIAQDLHSAGAQVTIVQRSPTLVINIEPSAQLVYSIYHEGPSLEDCDLVTISVPLAVARKAHQLASDHAKRLDRELLDKLAKKGFRLDYGDDNTGWQFKYLTRGGGYYFNVGCSNLIVEGKVGLAQFAELERLLPDTDLVVLATGYKGQEALVEKLFGKEVAQRVGPVWNFGERQELRNMFQRTPQPGLWFIAGSFAQCRIYSHYLALQIQASEAGLLA